MDKLNIIKKEIIKEEDCGDGFINKKRELRYFVETNDGFDGTAQGYGYKSHQAIYKAYSYFKNRDKYKNQAKEIKRFLEENKDVKEVLDNYLSEDECLWRLKDGDPTSMEDLFLDLEESPEIIEKLKNIKHLWKAIWKHYEY